MNARREPRRSAWAAYALCWVDGKGDPRSADGWSTDRSASGIRISCPERIEPGTVVFLEARGHGLAGDCVVRHCNSRGRAYTIGLSFGEAARATAAQCAGPDTDYYEFLQISPTADVRTIHRVYRIMAHRLHPDNPETGDLQKFLILQAARYTLLDPERRAAYDAHRELAEPGVFPIFQLHEFVDGADGEGNRRLGILSLLYSRRRISPQEPGVSLFDLERLMGIPCEYLDFAIWYLKAKGFVTVADNSEMAITATGVDFVEANATAMPVLEKLIENGPFTVTSGTSRYGAERTPADALELSAPAFDGAR